MDFGMTAVAVSISQYLSHRPTSVAFRQDVLCNTIIFFDKWEPSHAGDVYQTQIIYTLIKYTNNILF